MQGRTWSRQMPVTPLFGLGNRCVSSLMGAALTSACAASAPSSLATSPGPRVCRRHVSLRAAGRGYSRPRISGDNQRCCVYGARPKVLHLRRPQVSSSTDLRRRPEQFRNLLMSPWLCHWPVAHCPDGSSQGCSVSLALSFCVVAGGAARPALFILTEPCVVRAGALPRFYFVVVALRW